MLLPVPRQAFGDAVDLVVGDTTNNVTQIGFWIDGIQFGCFDQGIDGGSAVAAGTLSFLI